MARGLVLFGTAGSDRAAPSATAIALGWIHRCALTNAGGVMCWGYNSHDELGDGTDRERWRPVSVSGLDSGVRAIATGARHGCALLTGGSVKCWGYNYYGQLGDGTNVNRSAPVDVSALRDVTAIAGGSFHSCALTHGGGVECWGYNGAGQLGDGTLVDRWTPVDVFGLSGGVTAVAAGDSHSCAIVDGGRVECWGDNRYGQLGDGTTRSRLTPVAVSGLSGGVIALALGGRHSCAIVEGDRVKCWGGNGFGQVGAGRTRRWLTPAEVPGLSGGVTAIAAGDGHTCALTKAAGLKCWGYNGWAQLGDRTTVNRPHPVGVFGLRAGVTAISAGARHSCARTTTGKVRCWGYNYNGQLGDGTPDDRLRPVYVLGLGPPAAAVTIASGSTAVTRGRLAPITLRCTGSGCRGSLVLSARVRGEVICSARAHVPVRLATHSFSVAAGALRVVTVKLAPRGFKALLLAGRLRARALLRYSQPDDTTSERNRLVLMTAPEGQRPPHSRCR